MRKVLYNPQSVKKAANELPPVTKHVMIEGWVHRFIATNFGSPVNVFYLGYHCQGYQRGSIMHLDPRSYRLMTEDDRPHHDNVVVPFRRSA